MCFFPSTTIESRFTMNFYFFLYSHVMIFVLIEFMQQFCYHRNNIIASTTLLFVFTLLEYSRQSKNTSSHSISTAITLWSLLYLWTWTRISNEFRTWRKKWCFSDEPQANVWCKCGWDGPTNSREGKKSNVNHRKINKR